MIKPQLAVIETEVMISRRHSRCLVLGLELQSLDHGVGRET